MRSIVFIIFYLVLVTNGYSQHFDVSGKVSNEADSAIANVHVVIKGSSDGVHTDKNGNYTLSVKQGDILTFSYLGMQTVDVLVKNENTVLSVKLIPQQELLDSVVIKKRKRYSPKALLAEYHQNKNLIKTSMGIIDKDRASFSIQIIDGKNLIPVGTDFLYSLQNLYPSMHVDREDKNLYDPKVYLQKWSYNSQPTAIFDVDGVIYEQAPTFLEVNDIDRVAILVRNGAVSRYGTPGIGGVIIINTKSSNSMANAGIKRHYDNSDLRDSLYQVIKSPSIYAPEPPLYMKIFKKAKSESHALVLFEKDKKAYLNAPYYFMDVSDYFFNTWGQKKTSLGILAFMTKRFSTDVAILKAIAFKYEVLNEPELAFQMYLRILNIKPRHSQSHRDISNAYAQLGNYKNALSRYFNFESVIRRLDSLDFSASEVSSVMKTELSNIIKLHGKLLKISDEVVDRNIESPGTRLLFEWNNDQAEFEIRVVDTENNYYRWTHLRSEKNTIKQFFFDKTSTGDRQIQITYHGNRTSGPTYLKTTLFFNYGKHDQKSESRIYRLFEEGEDIQLMTFNPSKSTLSN